jgi:DNA-binding XRE family transcriptional regulator
MQKRTVGSFIKYHRQRINLSQEELAKKVKCQRQAIYELENNKCQTGFELVEDVLNCLGFELIPVEKVKKVKPTNQASR